MRWRLFYGHKACAGCGGSLAVRIALKVLGERSIAVLPAGCMSAVGFNFPQLCFGNNAIGSSSGAALSAAKKLALRGAKGNIVIILPDRGDRYFSKDLYGQKK